MIKVYLFAGLAEAAGKRVLEISVEEKISTQELKRLLVEQYPDLGNLLDKSIVAVNKEYADEWKWISDQDEVGMIPPVSGG
ncbi:MAG: molybdopterin converting factor subunit 1 [Thermoactinomyces sp.]